MMTHRNMLRGALVGALISLVAVMLVSLPAHGDQQITVSVGDQSRTCLVHLPPAYDGTRPLPLVIAIHGSGGNGKGMAQTTGFNALADQYNFIAAYPDAVGAKRSWYSLYGSVPGGQGVLGDDVDDVGFIRTLIDTLHTSFHTDPARVFACGHSSGAYMAYRVAIDLPDQIAAVGVVNGSLGIKLRDGKPSVPDIPRPAAPVSVIHIRGGKDNLVKFEGALTPRVVTKSVPECIQLFVKADGCATPGTETTDEVNGVTRTLYAGGKAGTAVELVIAQNCNHNWPIPQYGLSASQELWDFFSRHPKLVR
ncbi:MAG TPA: PHB depolymerase family esterase [Armatimonadota bacterium]|nr:PHB depolymerase family esterase [Armatimonadota bacterium]